MNNDHDDTTAGFDAERARRAARDEVTTLPLRRELLAALAEIERLREALTLAMGDDLRVNGCVCTEESMCYLHERIISPLARPPAAAKEQK